MQASYQNPNEREEILQVLDAAFPSIVERIELAHSLGWNWEDCTTPFVSREEGEIVAHVGVLETKLRVNGEDLELAGVHAVSCKPEHRRKGHMRRAMTAALAYIDSKKLPSLLTCEKPELYTSFGFEAVSEHMSWVSSPSTKNQSLLQALENNASNLEVLQQALQARAPISETWCMRDQGWVFGICEVFCSKGLQRIQTNESKDLFVVSQNKDNALHLYDIVAKERPSFHEVISQVPGKFDQVCIHFPTQGWIEPESLESFPPDDVLMVRGNLPLAEVRCFPPTARW